MLTSASADMVTLRVARIGEATNAEATPSMRAKMNARMVIIVFYMGHGTKGGGAAVW